MHEEIFSAQQHKLLPLVQAFSADFGLIGFTVSCRHESFCVGKKNEVEGLRRFVLYFWPIQSQGVIKYD